MKQLCAGAEDKAKGSPGANLNIQQNNNFSKLLPKDQLGILFHFFKHNYIKRDKMLSSIVAP